MRKPTLPLYLFATTFLFAQSQDTRPTLAVINFEGRGIAQVEAQTLTDRFSTSIGNTDAVRLVERRMMEEVLKEQGFQQTGCTSDECAVEVGQLLGVQYMVGGSIGKVGNTFTIDCRMISVETGESIRTRDVSYVGQVDGLIIEIEMLAYVMVEMEPPEELLERRKLGTKSFVGADAPVVKTRIGAMMRSLVFPGFGQLYAGKTVLGIGLLLSEAAVLGLFYTSFSAYQAAASDYDRFSDLYREEEDINMIAQHRAKVIQSREDINTNKQYMELLAVAAGGIWGVNVLHALLIKPGNDTADTQSPVRLAYDPRTKSPQLRFTINLDSRK